MNSERAPSVVFVLGAGASCAFGFPTGVQLMDQITLALEKRPTSERDSFFFPRLGDGLPEPSFRLFQRLRIDPNLARAARIILNEMPGSSSIDSFLNFRSGTPDVVRLGKLGIVDAISQAEQESRLVSVSESRTDTGWIGRLVMLLRDDITQENALSLFDPVAFINFNYDRSLEHAAFSEVRHRLGLDANQAQEVMQGLRVWRPYGSLGPLPWQELDGVPFGHPDVDIEALASTIRTFTEGPAFDGDAPWHETIYGASLIVFIGFGFHKQNVEMLVSRKGPQDVIFTHFKAREPDVLAFRRGIKRTLVDHKGRHENDGVTGVNLSADDFMEAYAATIAEYWRR